MAPDQRPKATTDLEGRRDSLSPPPNQMSTAEANSSLTAYLGLAKVKTTDTAGASPDTLPRASSLPGNTA